MFSRAELYCIRDSLKKPAPSGSLPEDTTNNFLAAFIEEAGSSFPAFRIMSVDGNDRFAGSYIASDTERLDACLYLPGWKKSEILIRQWYRENVFHYTSVTDYLWNKNLTNQPLRYTISQWLSRKYYEFHLKFRSDRIDLLKNLLEIHIRDHASPSENSFQNKGCHPVDLFSKVYGPQVWGHSKHDSEFAKFELFLDSFVLNGEMKNNSGKFRITGKAITTIAEFAESDRRHRDSINQSKWIVMLTIVIAISGLLAAIKPWFWG